MLTEQKNHSGSMDLNLYRLIIYRSKGKNAINKRELKVLFLKNSPAPLQLPERSEALSATVVRIPDFALFFLFFVSLFL